MRFRSFIIVATMLTMLEVGSIPVLASNTDNIDDLGIAEELDAADTKILRQEAKKADVKAGIYNVDYVATLIESEAGNVDNINGRIAVALTSFQRVVSDEYPNTIYKVVEQPYQYADLVGRYSDRSYIAAKVAISLWESGDYKNVLPDGFVYFFGYNRQNWFYRINDENIVEFYALPGQKITDDVYAAYKSIVGIKSEGYVIV